MNPINYLERRRERARQRQKMALLVGGPTMIGLFGLICLGVASESTGTSSGVSSGAKIGWLVVGVFLVLVAITIGAIAYRSQTKTGARWSDSSPPRPEIDRPSGRPGPRWEFWATTAIALLSLAIAAASAPWWWK